MGIVRAKKQIVLNNLRFRSRPDAQFIPRTKTAGQRQTYLCCSVVALERHTPLRPATKYQCRL